LTQDDLDSAILRLAHAGGGQQQMMAVAFVSV